MLRRETPPQGFVALAVKWEPKVISKPLPGLIVIFGSVGQHPIEIKNEPAEAFLSPFCLCLCGRTP